MCGDSWQVFATNCLYDPPKWFGNLINWWDWFIGLLLLLLALNVYRFWVLATQDRPTHMRLGWIRENREQNHGEGNQASRYLTDYRIYAFVVQLIGTIAAVVVLISLRNPLTLIDWLSAKTIPWRLSSDGVTEMLQMLRLIYASVLLWVVFSLAILAVLIIDPYGYHRYSLTPLSHDLTIQGNTESDSTLGTTKTLTIRSPFVYFDRTGKTLRLKELPKDAEKGWIMLSFIPSTGLFDRATLKGCGDHKPEVTFVSNGSIPDVRVERGKEFFIGESPATKIRFS